MLSYNPSLYLDSPSKTQRMKILCPGQKGKGGQKFRAIFPWLWQKRYQTINKNF